MSMDLKAFAKWVIDKSFEDAEVSVEDIQNKAVEHGILIRTEYDPEKHAEDAPDHVEPELGDEWLEYSDAFRKKEQP